MRLISVVTAAFFFSAGVPGASASQSPVPAVYHIKVSYSALGRFWDDALKHSVISFNTSSITGGNGYVISPDGVMATVHHVVGVGPNLDVLCRVLRSRYQIIELDSVFIKYRVTNGSGKIHKGMIGVVPIPGKSLCGPDRAFKAETVGRGARLSLSIAKKEVALLKVRATSNVYFGLGDSDSLETGDKVYVLYYSEEGGFYRISGEVINRCVSATVSGLVQMAVKISEPVPLGTSGAPLIDSNGDSVGTIFATNEEDGGYTYAVPSNFVRLAYLNATGENHSLPEKACYPDD